MMSANGESTRVLYTVVCAAPAASRVDEFVRLARDAGWTVRAITTPMGERFVDTDKLAQLTGDPVRIGFRMPDEPDELPKADAVVVAPATFNTINKWAAGITDTFTTGPLCELTGAGVPILAVPLLKAELARHLAFERSLEMLRAMGSMSCSIRQRDRRHVLQSRFHVEYAGTSRRSLPGTGSRGTM
jgi:phosphopantothenoylcysteine synthetase/decarboxylase